MYNASDTEMISFSSTIKIFYLLLKYDYRKQCPLSHYSRWLWKDRTAMYLLVVIFASVIVFIQTDDILENLYQNTKCGSEIFSDNASCYYADVADDILPLKENKISTNDNAIFFIETSCNGGLNFRQACSVEAAARAHPNRQINVLFAGPVNRYCLNTSPLWEILIYGNVNLYRIPLKKFFKKTPLDPLMKSGAVNQSLFPVHHIADALRFATLFKFGGIYLDLDVLVVKPLDFLPEPKNWIGREDVTELGPALLGLSRGGIGRKVATAMLRLLKINFQSNSWPYSSVAVLTEVLEKLCSTQDVDKMSSVTCKGFEVYPPAYFYPIKYLDWRNYFRKHSGIIPRVPFAFHLWNYVSHQEPIYDDSLYSLLMQDHCPRIFDLMT